jgi:hypothetical protein
VSAEIQIRLSPAVQRLISRGAPSVVLAAIARALDRENELTLGAAQKERLSFPRTSPPTPEGLRVQTNRLRQSLNRAPARIVGGAVISAIGSNVRYFGAHEFGFQGTVQVRAHVRTGGRRFLAGDGNTVLDLGAAGRLGALTRRGTLRRGTAVRELAPQQQRVRGHARRVDLPARRMVRRTVESRQENYSRRIGQEVRLAVTGEGGVA